MSLLRQLEQQYSNITAEVTSKIAKYQRVKEAEKKDIISSCEKLLQDAAELLEQMELAVREVDSATDKQKYANQVRHFKTDLQLLENEFKRILSSNRDRDELFGDDSRVYISDDQSSQLLNNTESLERGNRKLDDGYRTLIETEQIGADVLRNLETQRETILGARDKLRGTDEDLGESSKVLSTMIRRVMQNRALLLIVITFLVVIFFLIIFLSIRKPADH